MNPAHAEADAAEWEDAMSSHDEPTPDGWADWEGEQMTGWLAQQEERIDRARDVVEYDQPILDLLYDVAEWVGKFSPECIGEYDTPAVRYGDRPEPGVCGCPVTPYERRWAAMQTATLTLTVDRAIRVCDDETQAFHTTAMQVADLLSRWQRARYRSDLRDETATLREMLQ